MTSRMTGTDTDANETGGNIVQRARAYTRTVNAIPDYLEALGSRIDDFEDALGERVGALEQRFSVLEQRFSSLESALVQLQKDLAFLPQLASELDRIRPELAEIRSQLAARLEAEAEATELAGRLLQGHEARLAALEERAAPPAPGIAPAP